jgi:tetratricopeptide (TPR) repeat protein
MREPAPPVAGKNRSSRAARGILGALSVSAALFAAAFFIWKGRSQPVPTWDEIRRAAAGRRWADVEPKLERWISAHPDHAEAPLMLANLRLGLGRHDSAVAGLNRVPESNPSWSNAQTMLGELAIRERRAADAERIFRRVAQHDPHAVPARQRLIYVYGLEQRPAEARAVLWELYGIWHDPRVLVDLVLELLLDQEDTRGLAPEIEEFAARTPEDPFLQRASGLARLYQGRTAEALPQLEAAARALEHDTAGRFALAECRMILGKPVVVEDALGPCPDAAAEAAQWWLFRGQIEQALGLVERAVCSFERAVVCQPDGREGHFRLGQVLKRVGRAESSRRHLGDAARLEGRIKAVRNAHQQLRRGGVASDPELFERLGLLCRDVALIRESRAWFEQATKLDPSRQAARAALIALEGVPDSVPVALAAPRLAHPRSDAPSPTTVGVASNPSLKRTAMATEVPLEDRTTASGVRHYYESGATERLFIADTMGGGVGLIDFDDDGWLDIYFVNGCTIPFDGTDPPRPNVLYRNQGDGTFRGVTRSAGVSGRGYGMGCAVGDYDNDGHDDLFVTGLNQTILYRNRGDGTFEDVTVSARVFSNRWTTAAGFGDLDGDGDLDLVVITYVECALDDELVCRDHSGRRIHCAPARYPAQEDLLYRNNGDGTFTEVSRAAGFVAPNGRGLGLAIADLDGDGALDIFVANDGTPNFLFRNLGGMRFEEIGAKAGVATNGAGHATASMGVVADDLDGDGKIDLFITNLVNESSTLFRNLGGGLFFDATLGAGLDAPSRPKTGFGTAALDADSDGRLDLFVANGHVDDRPWANSPMAQTALFFWGRDAARFELAGASASSYFARRVVGRGVAAGDFDNDGGVDVVVVHRDAPAALLSNSSRRGHWLGLRLRGARSGRTAVGAQVSCRADGRSMVRWMTSGTGYLSAHDPRIWIGLGAAHWIDRLEVKWPSGVTQVWSDVAPDRILEIAEDRSELKEMPRRRATNAP